jgi:hypothetical protein
MVAKRSGLCGSVDLKCQAEVMSQTEMAAGCDQDGAAFHPTLNPAKLQDTVKERAGKGPARCRRRSVQSKQYRACPFGPGLREAGSIPKLSRH